MLQFLTTFTQVTARLKHFLMGWLLALGLKECLVKCATVCVKSVVILFYSYQVQVYSSEDNFCAVVRKPKLKDSKPINVYFVS